MVDKLNGPELVKQAVQEFFGDPCEDFDPSCYCCVAWKSYYDMSGGIPGAKFVRGDQVEKYTGDARWFGTIVSVYSTLRGKIRYMVEVHPQGFQMVTSEEHIRKASREPFIGFIHGEGSC